MGTDTRGILDVLRDQRYVGNRMIFNRAADEIEALARFLEIALDVHEDNFGRADEERYPKDWTVQARKRLAAISSGMRTNNGD